MITGLAGPVRTISIMKNLEPDPNTPAGRPATAVALTIFAGLYTALLILSLHPVGLALGLISYLITRGLWRGDNVAWALVIILNIIGGALSLLGADLIGLAVNVGVLVCALLPTTRAYYRPKKSGERDQLSFSWKGAVQIAALLVIGIIAILVIAGRME